MSWLRISFAIDGQHVAPLAELLQRFGADSVTVSALSSEQLFAEAEPGSRYWNSSQVAALFNADVDIDIVLACCRNAVGDAALPAPIIEAVTDLDWVAQQQQRSAMVIGRRLCICPSWEPHPTAAEFCLTLDPGLAFGSGSHQTTQLCLEWLVGHAPKGAQVLDYGCGSGVLGLAAVLLGADQVVAVDIDGQARAATRANAERNGLQAQVTVRDTADTPVGKFDLLLANILLRPILELLPLFKDCVAGGGSIVLSGILAPQSEQCLEAYSPWFSMAQPVFRDEWALLTGHRR